MPRQSSFPAPAVDWLLGPTRAHVLALGRSSAPLASLAASSGHSMVVCDAEPGDVRRVVKRLPAALPVVATPQALPFASASFDAVLINQQLHALDEDALAELARVLRPGGHLAVAYTVRDDAVPWVRRLVNRLREVDPDAMAGDYGADAIERLAGHPLFPTRSDGQFRLWSPVSCDELVAMVERRFPTLDAAAHDALVGDVQRLYADAARAPEPLLLPYRVLCSRVGVDRRALPSAARRPSGGLPITL